MADMQRNITDVVIIGAGPVGLFAVFELGMLKIRAHVVDTLPQVGGQCVALYPEKPIYDIPGFPSIEGAELIANLAKQAKPFSPTYHLGQQVVKLEKIPSTHKGPASESEHAQNSSHRRGPASESEHAQSSSPRRGPASESEHAQSSSPRRGPASESEHAQSSSPRRGPASESEHAQSSSPRRGEDGRGASSPMTSPSPHTASLPPAEEGTNFRITTDKHTIIECKAVIIAAGCGAFGPNRPPMDGLEQYEGRHVHYMVAQKDQFKGQTLVIAGGGDSAVDWANALSPVAEKIYVVHRRDKFRAMPESIEQMKAKPNVEMVIPYQLKSIEGDGATMRGVAVETLDGQSRTLPAHHLLAFFGLSMELGPIADWGLNLDMNHITVHPGTSETSTPGIFAIGDIATYEHKLKLILSGFAEAAAAAHKIRGIVYPGVAYHFEYSTSKGVPNAA